MRLPPPADEGEGINMTPVIDVVFLLLIFFLVATRMDRQERELKVVLPEVAQAQPLTMTQEVVVNVTRDGKYKILQKEYSEDHLLALLRESQKKNPHQKVLIRADGRSELQYAARIMGVCQKERIDWRLAALQKP